MSHTIAPGARVEIRDAEWLVRRVDLTPRGKVLHVTGLEDPVKDREALFLEELERVRVLRPEETRLVQDSSPGYRSSLLYLESMLRSIPPTKEQIALGHRGAMNPVAYQRDPTARALQQTRVRILLADGVGLGKTLEAGILLSELIRRGRGKRILVVALKSMMTQFQKELWNRFTIPLVRLDSRGIERVYSELPPGQNPFHYYHRTIISMDTLKRDVQYRTFLEKAWWDVIVIDEAHNVAERGGRASQRARLARLLSERSDSLILLSATPHDGKPESFASLMNMLDPTAIPNPSDYGPEEIKGLFFRRFKKDVQAQVEGSFRERTIHKIPSPATPEEEEAFRTLTALRHCSNRRNSGGLLFRTVLEKSLFSSPEACLQTLNRRIATLQKDPSPSPEAPEALKELEHLRQTVRKVAEKGAGRYAALLKLLGSHPELGWNPGDPRDRLVVFSERLETLGMLKEKLSRDLGLKENQVALLKGTMSDLEQQEVVEAFGREESPLRLLLASDVASEGINLHYLCHRLVHFDIPWSLMTFQQRNGRIDRYGQEQEPRIIYLVTETENSRIGGDLRILELLIRKDEEAQKNLGDPSAFPGLYNVEAEEEWTARAMEEGKTPEEVEQAPPGGTLNWLEALIQQGGEPGKSQAPGKSQKFSPELSSLYEDDFAYMKAALDHLASFQEIQRWEDPHKKTLEFMAPEDLERLFAKYPREIWPEKGLFKLTGKREEMEQEILATRSSSHAWPQAHYLWPLHPALEWLGHKVLTSFGRNEAPVIPLSRGLKPGETVLLLGGSVVNRRGHSLIHEVLGVSFLQGRFERVEDLASLLERTGLGREPLVNTGEKIPLEELQKLVPPGVHHARERMESLKKARHRELEPRLQKEKEALEALRKKHFRQLELDFANLAEFPGPAAHRRAARQRWIERTFQSYTRWVEETLTPEPEISLQLLAVLQARG